VVARLGDLIGEALALFGFNTNFAPLLDLATPFTEKTHGARTFGADPQQVAQCGEAFVRSMQRHRVRACGKHFPGLGSVPPQGSSGLATSGKPMAALWREDLIPYRQLLPNLPMVLISPAAYKAYDLDRPCTASLSTQIIEGLLRIKLGYRGLALAYELESEEVRGALDLSEAAIQSLNAGCDLLVVSQGGPFETISRAVRAGFESGRLSKQRVEQSLARIRAAKKCLALPGGKVSPSAFERLARHYADFTKEFRPEELKIA
jgi:beta-N-acetylhexosaminidase